MNKHNIKLPMEALMKKSLDDLKQTGDLTDAVVILLNQRTGDAQVGSMRGDERLIAEICENVIRGINRKRAGKAGLIIPQ